MTQDIKGLVGRLNGFAYSLPGGPHGYSARLCAEAASALEALSARLAEAEKVIAPFAARAEHYERGASMSAGPAPRVSDFRAAAAFLHSTGSQSRE